MDEVLLTVIKMKDNNPFRVAECEFDISSELLPKLEIGLQGLSDKYEAAKQISGEIKAQIVAEQTENLPTDIREIINNPDEKLNTKLEILKKANDNLDEELNANDKNMLKSCTAKFRDLSAFYARLTGVRFIKKEDPHIIECVISSKSKQVEILHLEVMKYSENDIKQQIYEAMKRVNS